MGEQFTPPEIGLDAAEAELAKKNQKIEGLNQEAAQTVQNRDATVNELNAAEAAERPYEVVDKRAGREYDSRQEKELQLIDLDKRQSDVSLDLAILHDKLAMAGLEQKYSQIYVDQLKADEAVLLAKLETAQQAKTGLTGQARHEVLSAAGQIGAAGTQIRRLERIGEAEQKAAEERGYKIIDRRLVDREGNPIEYQTTQDQIVANIKELQAKQNSLREQLQAGQANLIAVKEGEHPEMKNLIAQENELNDNLQALRAGKAPEQKEEVLADTREQAKTAEQQGELAAVERVQEREGVVLERNQTERRTSWLGRLRENIQRNPQVRRTAAMAGAVAVLIGVLGTKMGDATAKPGMEPVQPTSQTFAMPSPEAGAEKGSQYTVAEKPVIHQYREAGGGAAARETTAPAAKIEQKFLGKDASFWLNLAPNYPPAEIQRLMTDQSAKQDLEQRIATYQQDKQKNPQQVFDRGENDPIKAAYYEWLESHLSNQGHWR